MKRTTVFISLLILFIISPFHSALADATRFSIVNFRPAPDGGEYFSIESSSSLYQLQWTAGTMLDFGYKPLTESPSDRKIIEYLGVEHFYGAVGILDWLSFGFDLPVAWLNRFSDPDVTGAPFKNEWGLSDPYVQLKARVLDRARYPVGIAITPFVTVPVGRKDYFIGSDGVTGGGLLTVDAEFARRVWLALNGGVSAHKYVTWRNIDRNAVTVLLGGGVSVRATDQIFAAVEIKAETAANHFFSQREESPVEALGGVKYNIGHTGLQLGAGGGAGLVRGVGAPIARGFLGISYRSGGERAAAQDEERLEQKYVDVKAEKQREIEKVIALGATCPEDPADFVGGVDDEGCPKYYEMKEVADLIAVCPTRPEDFDPSKHSESCNKVFSLTDRFGKADAEAVYVMSTVGLSEKCPLDPARFDPKIDDPGCPKYYELKEVVPLIASCPEDAKRFKPGVDNESCPKVYEMKDAYQEENWMTIARLAKKDTEFVEATAKEVPAEAPVARAATEHAPPPLPRPSKEKVRIRGREIMTSVPITFGFDSYAITDESAVALGELADKIASNPRYGKIRIEGYADYVGGKVVNRIMSQRRAEAVMNYLKFHGIDISRMRIEGLGRTNKFSGGRKANRRVVFMIER